MQPNPESQSVSRRNFLAKTTATSAALLSIPHVITAAKSDSKLVLGTGDHKFEVQHNWPQLPSEYTWQTTHNVAVDKAGNLYVIHEGKATKTDHPSIFVFDSDGKFIRAFGSEYQGGGHGIEVRQEGNEEFVYVCAYNQVKSFAKHTLKGETVWRKHAPMQSQVYAKNEDTTPANKWGRDRFLPTNFAFLDNGEFLLADGYGSYYIHHYDKDANWITSFGGPGSGEGKFDTPHGIWVDRRKGREPSIVICDRAHNTLQIFDMKFKYLETITGFGWPANVDTWQDLLLVPELHARISLLDDKNKVVSQLGEDVERVNKTKGLRSQPKKWIDGKFVHPHDACFDADGNIFVAEWVSTGRISRLKRLS